MPLMHCLYQYTENSRAYVWNCQC